VTYISSTAFAPANASAVHKQQNHFWKPVINLDKLWSLVPAEKRDEYLAKKGDKAPVLNLLDFGYSKVLGKGRLPEVPIVVRAR
jgi:large subunit ribosomal protein L27Ae